MNYLTRMSLSQKVYARYKIPCFVFINVLFLRFLGPSAIVAVAHEKYLNHKNLLSRKAPKCPVLRHLDYRLGRGIRKIPDYACISGTLLIASRTLPTIPVFLFLCPNSTLFPKWGKIRQITSLIRSKIVVKIGVSYYSP